MTKQRADISLVARGLAESRAKAQALIKAGLVRAGSSLVQKPGETWPEDTLFTLTGLEHPWVSRGGMKLAHGLSYFGFDPKGRTALDIGASTGGFSDVLLSHDTAKIYAVDVGHDQLATKLRHDPRVIMLEKTNARYLSSAQIPEPITALVCDASFIGLQTILPAGLALCAPGAFAVALIKPQFEAGPEHIGKNGVVRDSALHAQICARLADWLATQSGWQVVGVTPSPIQGPEGNVEFLLGAVKTA